MESNLTQEIKDLVIARIQTLPSGKKISIGGKGDFSKEDIIKHIQQGDDIGQKMIDVEMSYLRLLKEGILYEGTAAHHFA